MAYYRAKRIDDAITALEKACRISPRDADIHANLGALKRKKGNLKAALRHLQWAVKLKPDDAAYRSNLGVAYRHAKKLDKAVVELKKAIELDPEVAEYHFNLGVAYRGKSWSTRPSRPTTARFPSSRHTPRAWWDLGYMHRLNHDNDKAIEAFRNYLDLVEGKDASAAKRAREEIEALQ